MEAYSSSGDLVVQLGDSQRKAMFAKLRLLGEGAGKSTRGQFHSIGSTIGNIRTMPTATHHLQQASAHVKAAHDAAAKGNQHLARLHNSLAGKHQTLARHVQAVRSPEFHRTHAAASSHAADTATMMGEHGVARTAAAESHAHERMATLKEEGQKEASVSSDQLRRMAREHRLEAGIPEVYAAPGYKEKHAAAAQSLEDAAGARDAARSEFTTVGSAGKSHHWEALKARAGEAANRKFAERAANRKTPNKPYGDHVTAERYSAKADEHAANAEKHEKLAAESDAAQAQFDEQARPFEGNTASEHRNAAMTHYQAGREASLKGDHVTSQRHYAQADFHMIVARQKDAQTLGPKHLLGKITDTANEHLATIKAGAQDRLKRPASPAPRQTTRVAVPV